jgi:hypothetical protein
MPNKQRDWIVFTGARDIWARIPSDCVENVFSFTASSRWESGASGVAQLVKDSKIMYAGSVEDCMSVTLDNYKPVGSDSGSSIFSGLMPFGSLLESEEIEEEYSIGDGVPCNPFTKNIPRIMGDVGGVLKL